MIGKNRNVMMMWVQMQLMLVLYFFFLYWLLPKQYIVTTSNEPGEVMGDSPLDKVLVSLSLAIEYQLGGGDFRRLGWQVHSLGTLQRMLSFSTFALGSIMSAQSVADQVRQRNDADLLGIVRKEAPQSGAIKGDYVRTAFIGNAVLHVLFAMTRETRMWDLDEMNEKYSMLSGTFMIVACVAVVMDALEWSSNQKEEEFVKRRQQPAQQQPAPPPPPAAALL